MDAPKEKENDVLRVLQETLPHLEQTALPKSSPINRIEHPMICVDDQTVGFIEEGIGGATTRKTEHSLQ
ncbi:uncharacterized protein FTJAE_14081 [Fusarium tjaetaba]|uniref:Uncharacterized protein n=1 Tax=Fusarium tjaetaba TaxID=1567544 RepID=A0A8H5V6H7_9HYPO|nr:uncharacterized protein FTJAE_14081 [Fusarium tjaetaba]KAF5612361.1 hypothetical protein FTJAE_14081 [Fusarium tjaetaba]